MGASLQSGGLELPETVSGVLKRLKLLRRNTNSFIIYTFKRLMVRIVKSKYMQTDSVEVIDSQKEENILNYKV